MKPPRQCCDQNCNQGDLCPQRRATPPTVREWLFVGTLLMLGLSLSLLSGCGVKTYADTETGCEYLMQQYPNSGITPRMGRDSKQICRQVAR